MVASIPLELYNLIFKVYVQEHAETAAKAISESLSYIEKKANDTALKKNLELKDELTRELATKSDLLVLRSEINIIRSEMEAMEQRMIVRQARFERNVYVMFALTLSVVIITNQNTIEFIFRVIGILK
ncbi:MAG: hypothetical protein SFY32_01010 [Bacteroidota bacterium]|nr:hypothetical protein [Bacteroidota bacterium]